MRKQNNAGGKRDRLQKAYNSLKSPKSTIKDYRSLDEGEKLVEKHGVWKGDLKKKFNKDMGQITERVKKTYNRMDEYHDDIQDEINRAQRESNQYIPILTDIKTALTKLTN
ncbi:DUF5082 family protein [Clostridiales bacterium]|nr:DUF5082 family protein [Clostridiales bacterium]